MGESIVFATFANASQGSSIFVTHKLFMWHGLSWCFWTAVLVAQAIRFCGTRHAVAGVRLGIVYRSIDKLRSWPETLR